MPRMSNLGGATLCGPLYRRQRAPMPEGVTLTPEECYEAASKVQLASWELLSRVVAARNIGASIDESDVRLLVALRADCMRHERFPR